MKKIFLLVIIISTISAIYSQSLFWIDSPANLIQSVNLNGSGLTTVLSGIKPGFGCAYDASSGFIYYTDMVNKTINKVKNDGSLNQVVVTQAAGQISIPRGIALNLAQNIIYWSDNGTGKIKRADLTGTNVVDLVSGLNSPSFVAYDNVNFKIYWADNGSGAKKIQRCDTSGANVVDFVNGMSSVWGIGLDLMNGYLYWIDHGIEKIQKKLLTDNIVGNKTNVIVNLTGNQRGLAVDVADSKILWSSVNPPSSSAILSDDLNNSTIAPLISSLDYPQGITLDVNSALPVMLTTFTSNVQQRNTVLNWSTQTEINTGKFIVERKINGSNWLTIASIIASGFSNSPKQYSYIDKNLQSGKYHYRLKMIDNNGSFEYSNIIESNVALPSNYELSQNYPNPFNPSTKIDYNLPSQSSVRLALYDAIGKEKIVLVNKVQDAGFYSYTIDSKRLFLSSGIYFYRLSAVSSIDKFSEIKKMVLLK